MEFVYGEEFTQKVPPKKVFVDERTHTLKLVELVTFVDSVPYGADELDKPI